jgi:putative ABC transport system ATP-binding protein
MKQTTSAYLVETHDLTRFYGDGEQIHALDGVDLKVTQGELVMVMGPSGSGKSTLTAQENAEIPMMGQMGMSARRKRAKDLLELVGLGERANHLPTQLSGGQRQRVAVARWSTTLFWCWLTIPLAAWTLQPGGL